MKTTRTQLQAYMKTYIHTGPTCQHLRPPLISLPPPLLITAVHGRGAAAGRGTWHDLPRSAQSGPRRRPLARAAPATRRGEEEDDDDKWALRVSDRE
jgi:hypothetical protein